MKNVTTMLLLVTMVTLCGVADAGDKWDDMSWWGNTDDTNEPFADKTRSGYWWWPEEPDSNTDDQQIWGNRGVVYTQWEKSAPAPTPKPTPTTPPRVEQPKVERKVIVLNNVLFDFDKSTLKAEGKTEVGKLVADLKAHPGDLVVIEGHTCNTGAAEYNVALGQRRADAVKAFMVDSGISASRIDTVGYGETRPAVSNETVLNRKLNRRAEFKITMGD
jgi:outer membrane protein OmpA-like peptidoglycan-associated protein